MADSTATVDRVTEAIRSCKISSQDEDAIVPEARLIGDLHADSLDLSDLLVALEAEFEDDLLDPGEEWTKEYRLGHQLKIDDKELPERDTLTVQMVADLIDEKIAAARATWKTPAAS